MYTKYSNLFISNVFGMNWQGSATLKLFVA